MTYLTAVRLTLGGSSTLHIYTKTIHRTKQRNNIQNNTNKQYIEQHIIDTKQYIEQNKQTIYRTTQTNNTQNNTLSTQNNTQNKTNKQYIEQHKQKYIEQHIIDTKQYIEQNKQTIYKTTQTNNTQNKQHIIDTKQYI